MPYRPRSDGRCAKGLTEAGPTQPRLAQTISLITEKFTPPMAAIEMAGKRCRVFMRIFFDRSLRNDS
jgi:hypothetical protein